MIKITTDSTSDLQKWLIEKYNISIIPLVVTLGENDYLDNGVEVTEDKIFNFVKETKAHSFLQILPVVFLIEFFLYETPVSKKIRLNN